MKRSRKYKPITITPENRPKPKPIYLTFDEKMLEYQKKELKLIDSQDFTLWMYFFKDEFRHLRATEDDFKYFITLIPDLAEKMLNIEHLNVDNGFKQFFREQHLLQELGAIIDHKLMIFKPIYEKMKPYGSDELYLLMGILGRKEKNKRWIGWDAVREQYNKIIKKRQLNTDQH